MRITLQPAFVLHHRPYRETSLLLDLFTPEHGRISAVARGVRQTRSKWRSILQPFIPLMISWQGKTELMTLVSAETNGLAGRLQGECLLSGLYLNEILMRLLQKHDPHPQLYTIYQQTLLELQSSRLEQKTLRLFEKKLLDELGYGLQLMHEVSEGQPFQTEKYYRFHPEHGFEIYCGAESVVLPLNVFAGKSLLALAAEQLDDVSCLRDAKRLMRLALTPLLGQGKLHSRRLFDVVA
jgi:DNA repair protein RecO (recombination protein O)